MSFPRWQLGQLTWHGSRVGSLDKVGSSKQAVGGVIWVPVVTGGGYVGGWRLVVVVVVGSRGGGSSQAKDVQGLPPMITALLAMPYSALFKPTLPHHCSPPRGSDQQRTITRRKAFSSFFIKKKSWQSKIIELGQLLMPHHKPVFFGQRTVDLFEKLKIGHCFDWFS